MPRYFFNQWIDGELLEDPDGFEYPSLAAARSSAVVTARRLWATAIAAGEDLLGEIIDIHDASGRRVDRVPLVEGLPFRLACAATRTAEESALLIEDVA